MPPKKKGTAASKKKAAAAAAAATKKSKKVEEEVVEIVEDKDEEENAPKKPKTVTKKEEENADAAADDDDDGDDDDGSPDVLKLKPLFKGAHGPWYSLLKDTIEKAPNASTFIGPTRDASVVPVRELTFQALKPNPPEKWQVVVFGQNPYPRVESATGIAMLDNTFKEWEDKRFGVVTSMRCIMKTACIWKYGIPKATPVAEIRKILKKNKIVNPHGWFQAMLSQGCLLMNAALTASTDKSLSTSKHTTFWRPIITKVVEEILRAKQQTKAGGVVFAWWGSHAKALRKLVVALQEKFPDVPVEHVDYCNPAAMGDAFCNSNHFEDLNTAIKEVGGTPIDWLPQQGWDTQHDGERAVHVSRMGQFVTDTLDLQNEVQKELEPIRGVYSSPLLSMGAVVTWWGVSSCTVKEGVARGFLGGKGMLFSIKPRGAVSIKQFSAFQGEDEYIVNPGARLKVLDVKTTGNVCNVTLQELEEEPLVT
ncbi:uracil-DNA glycosylase [Salpingoeca rosetta]|uniref:NAD(P)(+)--arginine ADP-ribosyltransferase n=1 Tax=Salpingoeca rosetta (strain ATCC 50818 / BSB-021) TaxID=946362 RepID=F2UQK7_SALR5|nr:uracil-DNA glycosylase [Salpingoeca rosetta]EGD79912.1 uracil-DNA glycosylase [Salpingoeca rosetta]|eukprot:XP_004988533.1 uracil-DNA glycosylase [Salpingoeca rosetta]